MRFTMEHVRNALADPSLTMVYKNSLLTAILTAALGTLMAYGAAIVTARSSRQPGEEHHRGHRIHHEYGSEEWS